MPTPKALRLESFIRDVPDYPKPGIVFKDITPLLRDHRAFKAAIDAMVKSVADLGIDAVVGIESRGFILAPLIAQRLRCGFIPVRKPGKLPWKTRGLEYALEYGSDRIEIHEDALAPGAKALVVDDVLATGGTAAAACTLVESLGATVVGACFLIELGFLGGRAKLSCPVRSTIIYP